MKKYLFSAFLSVCFQISATSLVYSQAKIKSEFGNGINITAADSSFSINFGTRMQLLYDGALNVENNDWSDQFLIRRARLKFSGFAYHPSLTYKLELGLSNRDTGGGGNRIENDNTANIIVDAVIKWNFYKNFSLWLGQTKLPGNRGRVISSQELQLVDRSLLNSRFNIDRDVGIQLHHHFTAGNVVFREKLALSMGEGKNITVDNRGGYDYTLRFEVLPFGNFEDYVVTDFERSPKPLLSAGIAFDYNDGASRQRGQTGSFVDANTDLRTLFADALFKYNGFSTLMEYANKKAPDGALIVGDPNIRSFYTGEGFNIQAGYLFKNDFEIAGRYTSVRPNEQIPENDNDQYTLGISKYFVGHSLKIQSDVSFISEANTDDFINYRFQLELAL